MHLGHSFTTASSRDDNHSPLQPCLTLLLTCRPAALPCPALPCYPPAGLLPCPALTHLAAYLQARCPVLPCLILLPTCRPAALSCPASPCCPPASLLPCPALSHLELGLADGEQPLNHELHSLVDLSLVQNAAEALKDACRGARQEGEEAKGGGEGRRQRGGWEQVIRL